MKILEDKIRAEGKILPGPVLKVSSFLNHQMDPDLIMELGRELADRFRADGVTKILTIESSGIAIAVAVGAALHVPVLFAKKHRTSNVSGVLYQTLVHSYTHGTDYTVVVEREYLSAQAGATVVGAGIVIEKGFQDGGLQLRASGLRVESLAIVDSMNENAIVFRES